MPENEALKAAAKRLFVSHETPLADDPMNMTLARKLVINVAPTGSFLTKEENPNQPMTPKEIARTVIASYRAGAAVWHVHCRDEDGVASSDVNLVRRTIDMVMEECPDIITSLNITADVTKPVGIQQIEPLVGPLSQIDLKYIRMAVVPPCTRRRGVMTKAALQEIVGYLQDKGIRPEFQIHHYEALMNVVNWLIKPGILKPPYIMNIILGHHAFTYSGPVAPDPWGHIYLITMMNLLPPDSIIGLTAGGHNWMPITVEGIILGVDMVRVGTEDTLWMFPHRPEMATNCEEMVERIATICHQLGREIATPAETRQILGLR